MEARQEALEQHVAQLQGELQHNRALLQETQNAVQQILVAVQNNAAGHPGPEVQQPDPEVQPQPEQSQQHNPPHGGNEPPEDSEVEGSHAAGEAAHGDPGSQLRKRLDNLQEQMNDLLPDQNRDGDPIGKSPFVAEIANGGMPPKFKLPSLPEYKDRDDPEDFIQSYYTRMDVCGANDVALCRAFPSVLERAGKLWFRSLEPASIPSFRDLSTKFVAYFRTNKKTPELEDSLLSIRQKRSESLKDYLGRFAAQARRILNLNPSVALTSAKAGLRISQFQDSLMKKPAKTYEEFLARAEKYIRLEENNKRGRSTDRDERKESSKDPRPDRGSRREDRFKRERPESSRVTERRSGPKRASERYPDRDYTRLRYPISEVYALLDHSEQPPTPRPMRSDRAKRDPSKYCAYHKDVGHDTDDCISLKNAIEELIKNGKLGRFVKKDGSRKDDRGREDPPVGTVNVVDVVGRHGGT